MLGPTSIAIAETAAGVILWASDDESPATAPMRVYTPMEPNSSFAWQAFAEPITLSAAGENLTHSSMPLEQLNLTQALTGYLKYQTTFGVGDNGQVLAANLSASTETERTGSAATAHSMVTLSMLITGRTNNAYIVAVDGHVVAKLESRSGTCALPSSYCQSLNLGDLDPAGLL